MATLPSTPITWTGAPVTSAQMNANVRDVANILLYPLITEAYVAAPQNVANNAWGAISLDGNTFNQDAMWAAGTNNRFTCQTDGIYLISGQVSYASNATGRRIAGIGSNGGSANLVQTEVAVNTANTTAVAIPARRVLLHAGDYIQLMGFQTSGGALALQTGNAATFLSAQLVGIL